MADTSKTIQIILGDVPSKSNSYKIITLRGHGSLAKTAKLKEYERAFFAQCNHYRNRHIDTPFHLHVDVFYPTKRKDLDNSLKIILDCLQSCGAITNDRKCYHITARKHFDKVNPRIAFYIEPHTE